MCVACDLGHPEACANREPPGLRCERCGRFISPDTCLGGWDGGLMGDYNDRFYCAAGKGCNRELAHTLAPQHFERGEEGQK